LNEGFEVQLEGLKNSDFYGKIEFFKPDIGKVCEAGVIKKGNDEFSFV